MKRQERIFVWLGGALFITSLAVCAWRFLVSWPDPSPGSAPAQERWPLLVADALLFGVFALHHSLLARERVKIWLARLAPERLLRSVYVWTASLLLLAVCWLWQPIGGDVYRVAGGWAVALASVQLAGVWLIARAVGTIDPLELAGIRRQSASETLQIAGPYRWVRHPLYLGWLLVVFGAAHMTSDRLAFAAISSFYVIVAIPWEERSLIRTFGQTYEAYKARVRWRVVPLVY